MENRKINNKNIKINRAIYDKSSVIFFFYRMDSLKNSLAFTDIFFLKNILLKLTLSDSDLGILTFSSTKFYLVS